MAFWSTDFMNARREAWLASLQKMQYLADGTWHDAAIVSKKVTGNRVVVIASLPHSSGKQTVSAVRILDTGGSQAGYQEISLTRTASQRILVKFEFPIYEKEDDSE